MFLSPADSQRSRTGLFLRRLLPEAHELSAGAGLVQTAHLQQDQQSAGPGPAAGLADGAGRPPALRVRHLPRVTGTRRPRELEPHGDACSGKGAAFPFAFWITKGPRSRAPRPAKGGQLACLCHYCHRNTVT